MRLAQIINKFPLPWTRRVHYFEIHTAMTLKNITLLNVMPCNLVHLADFSSG
jgi:hypothetical protein